METALQQAFLTIAAIELLLKLTLALGAIGVCCLLLSKVTAAIRQSLWFGAILLALCLPMMNWLLPSSEALAVFSFGNSIPETSLGSSGAGGLVDYNQLQEAFVAEESNTGLTATLSTFALLIWLAGTLVFLAIIPRDLRRAAKLLESANSRNEDQIWPSQIAAESISRDQIGLSQINAKSLPSVLYSEDIATPITVGVLTPSILLPTESLSWDRSKLESALLHELAHVRSRDNLVRILASLACAVYWFHPLMWYSARKLKEEQEKAADNFVLNNGVSASLYAQNLLDIVKSIQEKEPQSELVATTMGSYSFFPQRMRALLKENQSRHGISFANTFAMLLLLFVCTVPLASMTTLTSSAQSVDSNPAGLSEIVSDSDAIDIDSAEDPKSEEAKQIDEILQRFAGLNPAFNSGDFATSLSYYSEDAIVETIEDRYVGAEQIDDYLKMIYLSEMQILEDEQSISVNGNEATVTGKSGIGLGGSSVVMHVNYIMELRRLDGIWMIVKEQSGVPNFSLSGILDLIF